MRKRSFAREIALQVLYQIDITRDAFDQAWESSLLVHQEEELTEDVKAFAQELIKGVLEHVPVIDTKISALAANWELDRMAVVDRNILRLGSYELMFRSDIPPKVSINEAVELAKKFSDVQAGKFVNGILDKIKAERKT